MTKMISKIFESEMEKNKARKLIKKITKSYQVELFF
jgi:hypothetical protein